MIGMTARARLPEPPPAEQRRAIAGGAARG